MKRSDSGDFCVLYIEPEDDKAAVFAQIGGQKKPVVLLLSPSGARTRVFQRPEDFSDLKHLRRQNQLTLFFVIMGNDYLRQLATRNGFATYASMDELGATLEEGRSLLTHQRAMAKSAPLIAPTASMPPAPRVAAAKPAATFSAKKTVPLGHAPVQPFARPQSPAPTPTPPPAPARTPIPAPRHTSDPGTFAAPTLPLERPPASNQKRKRGSRGVLIAFVLVSIIVLAAGGLGYFVLYARGTTPTSAVVTAPKVLGQVNFLSSEQISETSNAGLNDEVELDLHGIQSPAPGNSFYAWLLGDQNSGDSTVISLGRLTLDTGNAHLLYTGDAQHTNLLDITSRFLVTEESATTPPVAPSPDYSTWRYYGIIPQTPDPQDPNHFSYLDHLRHLLASDPLLNSLELPGGLCNWFYRNTDKLLEWTVSARDRWDEVRDTGFAVRQTLRTLAYLDGLSFVARDLPQGMTLPDTPHVASVGLINVQSGNQTPPSYIAHILHHLNGLLNAPGSTQATRQASARIIDAISNVQQWLQKLHDDARQFVSLSNAQLLQPAALALLNDMVQQANAAYSGQTDPVSGAIHQGVAWIHAQAQGLAAMDVYQYVMSTQTPEVVPGTSPFTWVGAMGL